jgi:hypothetical protein
MWARPIWLLPDCQEVCCSISQLTGKLATKEEVSANRSSCRREEHVSLSDIHSIVLITKKTLNIN